MKESSLLPIELSDGNVVMVEVKSIEPTLSTKKKNVSTKQKPDKFSFDTVKGQLKSFSEDLVSSFESIKPDKLSIEMGCEFAVESGKMVALFVQGTAKSNIKITLEWNDSKKSN